MRKYRLSLSLFELFIVILTFSFVLGCPNKTQKRRSDVKGSRSQLLMRAKKFNNFLRWRTFTRAKLLVAPGLRAAYMLKWEKERELVRISEFALRDITMVKDGIEAIILVVQKGFSLNSPIVKRTLIQQKWRSHDGVWFYIGNVKALDSKKQPSSKRTRPPKIQLPISKTID